MRVASLEKLGGGLTAAVMQARALHVTLSSHQISPSGAHTRHTRHQLALRKDLRNPYNPQAPASLVMKIDGLSR